MRKLLLTVVLIGCLAGFAQAGLTPPPGTVVLDEDFEIGYVPGVLKNQVSFHLVERQEFFFHLYTLL